ncbi:MAG: SPFH domain / Band 7 family protein [candidate division BRC1 bacterium ADurb.BinA364]|nr:MAG: SPFH domain / Band 7 family protein [candidate division BRC1 bacterium ADurb.BinA364]
MLASVVFLFIVALIVVGFVSTGFDEIEPGQAAVVINNVTRAQSVVTDVGYIIHLPYGMSKVYKYRTVDRIVRMQGDSQDSIDSIRVKTSDGSNVDVDVEIKYHVIREEVPLKTLANDFGNDPDLALTDDIVIAFGRSDVREILGKLSISDITDASTRQAKAIEIRAQMNSALNPLGLMVDSVSIPNLVLNAEYQQLIQDRKDANQELRNQESAQERMRQAQAREVAAANREMTVALTQERGLQEKRLIEARGKAQQVKERAAGESAKLKYAGDQAYQVAINEAKAIELEGLLKAEGIQKLAEAYELGGMALVRESLAQKYLGRTINGRPYDLSSQVERLAIEPSAAAAAAARGGGQAQ